MAADPTFAAGPSAGPRHGHHGRQRVRPGRGGLHRGHRSGNRRGDRSGPGRRRRHPPVPADRGGHCRGHRRRARCVDHGPPMVQHAGDQQDPADLAAGGHGPVPGRPAGLPPFQAGRPPAGPCRCRRGGGHLHAHAAGVLHVGRGAGAGLAGQPAGRPPIVRVRSPAPVPDADGAEPTLHQGRRGTIGSGPGCGRRALGHRPREPRRRDGGEDPRQGARGARTVCRGGGRTARAPPGGRSAPQWIRAGHLLAAQPRGHRPAGPGHVVGGPRVGVDRRRGPGHVPVQHPDPAHGDPGLHVPGDAALGGRHGPHRPCPGGQPRVQAGPRARRTGSGRRGVRPGVLRPPACRIGCRSGPDRQDARPGPGAGRPVLPGAARRVGRHGRCHRLG